MRLLSLFSLLLLSCSTTTKESKSYCEALCDWAVSCAASEREVDEAALSEQCLTDTSAVDEGCGTTPSDPASQAALDACTGDIDVAASNGECSGFTGTVDELKSATTPTSCATQGTDAQATFSAAQSSTQETGAELCERFSQSFCDQLQTCVLGALGVSEIPQELIDAAGGTPADLCMQAVEPQTTTCTTNDLYAAEESLDDVNTARQSARACISDLGTLSCEDILAGNLSATCAAAFSSTEDATAFGTAVVGVAGEYVE